MLHVEHHRDGSVTFDPDHPKNRMGELRIMGSHAERLTKLEENFARLDRFVETMRRPSDDWVTEVEQRLAKSEGRLDEVDDLMFTPKGAALEGRVTKLEQRIASFEAEPSGEPHSIEVFDSDYGEFDVGNVVEFMRDNRAARNAVTRLMWMRSHGIREGDSPETIVRKANNFEAGPFEAGPYNSNRFVHQLKTHAKYFQDILDGVKTFEVCKNDRQFNVGDHLKLVEVEGDAGEEQSATGRVITKRVGYILGGLHGVADGYVVMSLVDVE
jgi:hypothetical protein